MTQRDIGSGRQISWQDTRGGVHVSFLDTTMRDGDQALPADNQIRPGRKAAVAASINRLAVSTVEAGFPRTECEVDEVKGVVESIGEQPRYIQHWSNKDAAGWLNGTPIPIDTTEEGEPPIITGLARANLVDVDAVWEAVQGARHPGIHTFASTDPDHMKYKYGRTPEETLAMAIDAVKHAREIGGPSTQIEFSAEVATTSDRAFLERILRDAVYNGADVINVPDTVGIRNPFSMLRFYSQIIRWVTEENPDATISAHNHNDFDHAVSNTVALVHAAIQLCRSTGKQIKVQLESTICGIGERAGNADIFPIMATLFGDTARGEDGFRPEDATVTWDFNPGNSYSVAREVMDELNMYVPDDSPVVGDHVIAHGAGIHANGADKGKIHDALLYNPFRGTFYGHDGDFTNMSGGKYRSTR